MISVLNAFCNGYVAFPVIEACKRRGLFALFSEEQTLDASFLAQKLKANAGYFNVALHTLERLGWIVRTDNNACRLTDKVDLDPICQDLIQLYRMAPEELLHTPAGHGLVTPQIEHLLRHEDAWPLPISGLVRGAVLLPLFIALKQSSPFNKPLFTDLPEKMQTALGDLFLRKKWAEDQNGKINLTASGRALLGRVDFLAEAAAWRPLLADMFSLLFEKSAVVNESETIPALRHSRYFKEAREKIVELFNQLPVEEQPKHIADMGCGDGTFLQDIYTAIQYQSERGKVLDQFPLTLIGIDKNPAALQATEKRLAGLPLVTIEGDMNAPAQILEDLAAKGIVDPNNIIHVRAFMDHNFICKAETAPGTGTCKLSLTEDGAYVDADGECASVFEILNAWRRHLQGWAAILSGHGLLLLESHCVPVSAHPDHLYDLENFSFETLHAFSRQYLINAEAFLIVAASVGLFAKTKPERYPAGAAVCSKTLSHLEKRNYIIRFAKPGDLKMLYELEKLCWEKNQAPQERINQLLEKYPQGQFVLEYEGNAVGVIYSQRIESVDALNGKTAEDVHNIHNPDGAVVQLLAVNVHPRMQGRRLGGRLLDFMLQRCSLMDGVASVIGVTLCKDYDAGGALSLEDYVRANDELGHPLDAILRFNSSHGARVDGILTGYPSKNAQNEGYGVLVSYDPDNASDTESPQPTHVVHPPTAAFRSDDIAIVGMACRFPGARNYDEFWENLIQAKNSIVEIPAERWDWEEYYGDPEKEKNKTKIKWGGFIEDMDKFDPLFFNISPKEANYIDPQHRIFLESAWHAIEDAGYDPGSLSGSKVGVYAGVSKNDYAELMREKQESIISFVSTGTVHSIVTNRVSFLLDFRGKSEVVDTACSSFKVALHNAVRDIQFGICEAAVVGGINAILTPTMYISHGKSGMLSEDGVCKTFDAGANGYVRGEGVGVVFIKPLKKAKADQDNIIGVIKGIAVQHGGRSNFLTSPKVSSQASVISAALQDAGVDPKTVGYIEAHGTGTPLGDPIEINALKKAFAKHIKADDAPYCGLGSVKTNIGHLESAAGIAGLIKILLCFKHRKIPALLHFQKLNPYIKLDDSPFFIVDQHHDWRRQHHNGTTVPLRAGLSSFGMGGVNAHLILEEPPRNARQARRAVHRKAYLIPLSAKTQDRLTAYAAALHTFLETGTETPVMNDIAYTLQTGRAAMTQRVLFLSQDSRHLMDLLQHFIDGRKNKRIFTGKVDPVLELSEPAQKIANNNWHEIARQWVQGQPVDWQDLYQDKPGYKITLPVYPFQKMRCWFPTSAQQRNKPLTHQFNPTDYFIRDHKVKGEQMVPGVKYLEVFRAAGEQKYNQPVRMLRDVFWLEPIKAAQPVLTTIQATEKNNKNGQVTLSLKKDGTVFSTGDIVPGETSPPARKINIAKIKRRCTSNQDRKTLYTQFRHNGLDYGDTFQVIQTCRYNRNEMLCELRQSSQAADTGQFMEPSMMDGVFQCVAALHILTHKDDAAQFLPFYLKEVEIYRPIPSQSYVYARKREDNRTEDKVAFNMFLCDRTGQIVARFDKFVKRVYVPKSAPEVADSEDVKLLWYTSQWVRRGLAMHGENPLAVLLFDDEGIIGPHLRTTIKSTHLLRIKTGPAFEVEDATTCTVNPADPASLKALWQHLMRQDIKVDHIVYKWNFVPPSSIQDALAMGLEYLLTLTQSLLVAKINHRMQILYLYPHNNSLAASLHAMIGGFSRTLAYENPNLRIVSLGVDSVAPEQIARFVGQELGFYGSAPLNEVMYVNNQRNVRAIVPCAQPNSDVERPLLRQKGTYLITGGCGGLGGIFARFLAYHYKARLILLGRSSSNAAIEQKLADLRELGGSALYYAADIADVEALQQVFEKLHNQDIRLNGVMHCAGLIEDAFIIRKTTASLQNVIRPKVFGTVHLDRLTRPEPLDFFIVFSSIASVMPNQGQCDYAAANSFLDAFVVHRNQLRYECRRSGASIAINWPLWRNGGIGVGKKEEDHLWQVFGMKPLGDAAGLSVLEHILDTRTGFALDQVISIDGMQTKIEKHLKITVPKEDPPQKPVISEVYLKAQLTDMIARVHPKNRIIKEHENICRFGIESIGFAKLTARINQTLNLDIEPTLFFEYATVSEIADHLWKTCKLQIIAGFKAAGRDKPDYIPERALVDLDECEPERMHFQKQLSEVEFFMRDHVVEGQYNVPGACYIEMALQAGELLNDDTYVAKLTNNYWAKQLSTVGAAIQVDIDFLAKEGYYDYEISSFDGRQKQIHALGQVHTRPISNLDVDTPEQLDLASIKDRCTITRQFEEIYQFIYAEGLHLGPSLKPMRTIELNADEALAHLILPEVISKTVTDYVLHPTLLTGVLQTALLNNKSSGMDDTRFIPITMDDVRVQKKIPAECYVYTQALNPDLITAKVRKFNAWIVTTTGEVVVTIKGIGLHNLTATDKPASETASTRAKPQPAQGAVDLQQVEYFLKELLSEPVGLPASQIESDVLLESYGINSVMIIDLNNRLGNIFGNLSKTLFFEYRNVQELAAYFAGNHAAVIQQRLAADPAPQGVLEVPPAAEIALALEEENASGDDDDIFVTIAEDFSDHPSAATEPDDDIAVIGVSGRYPMARTLDQFWENLKQGKDCITEIPTARFDHTTFYDPHAATPALSAKWGGFIDDIDLFDPLLFNISPREATLIDPQERLFLQVVWETLEDAGYSRTTLKDQAVGVFVGAIWQPYTALGVEQTCCGNLQNPSGLLYSIPNRVSFFFDWSGPSLAIDTACSSSLTALHFACESLKRRECQSAIVGGVNLSLGSSKYLWLSQNNFLSSDGKCRSFGSGGDGYVPGEGVGAVYVKRLADALKDGDRIDGVIKGTSVNHGGRTNGFTVPNPNRQSDLILTALNKSEITPDRISYVEAHGTGTSLGDPIEISGLQKAFSKFTDAKAFCSIGSVKSNIGHLEAAAGIAGLTKLLLQMKHATLVPTIHAEPLNENIDFAASPFVVQKELTPWSNGQTARCAMLSSFGAGGSYAHAIVEEFQPEQSQDSVQSSANGQGALIPLSARTPDRLPILAGQLIEFLKDNAATANLMDVAYTLQTGREPLDERLVFLVKNLDELHEKLEGYLRNGEENRVGVYRGNSKTDKKTFQFLYADGDINQIFQKWMAKGDNEKIANIWIKGVVVDWQRLYSKTRPQRVSLPKYPFAQERYWIPEVKPAGSAGFVRERRTKQAEPVRALDMALEIRSHSNRTLIDKPAGNDASPPATRFPIALPADCQSQSVFPNLTEKPQGIVLTARKDARTIAQLACQEETDVTIERIVSPKTKIESPGAPESVLSVATLREELTISLAKALYMQQEDVDPDESFIDMGLDSIVGVEWIQTVNKQYGLAVSAVKVYDYPCIRQFADFLYDEIKSRSGPVHLLSTEAVAGRTKKPISAGYTASAVPAPTDGAAQQSASSAEKLQAELKESLAQALYIDASSIDSDAPFIDMGLDSIVGVEWIQAINRLYGLAVEATRVYDYPDIRTMARFLEKEIASHDAGPVSGSPAQEKTVTSSPANPMVIPNVTVEQQARPESGSRAKAPPDIAFQPQNSASYDGLYFSSSDYTGDFTSNGEVSIHYVLNTSNNVCLKDHRVFGRPIFPTDAYIELVYVACRTYFNVDALVMTDIAIVSLLVGQAGENISVTVLFRKHADGLRFVVKSSSPGHACGEKVHVRGFIQPDNGAGARPARYTDLPVEDVEARFNVDTFYDRHSNIVLGDFYRSLQTLSFGSKQAVGAIQPPVVEGRFLLHPSMVSAALACVLSYGPYQLGKQYDVAADSFLPHKIDNLYIAGPIDPVACLCYTEIKKIEKDSVELYFEMVDANRRPLLVCGSIGLQRVGAAKVLQTMAASTRAAVNRVPSDLRAAFPPSQMQAPLPNTDVAIIGMSCRFPQSNDSDAFWEALKNGTDCITEVPADRWAAYKNWYHPNPDKLHTSCSKWGGFIDDVDKFDPLFFNIAPTEAEAMDPQQRIFLEETWKTIESAGYNPKGLGSQSCGVYVGCTTGDYIRALAQNGQDTLGATFMGTSSAILVSRISYFLNLKGPSIAIDTACSSSLTAVHLACDSIRQGENHLAIAGGVNLFITPSAHILTSQVGLQSIDGCCYTFDDAANGTVFSEGCGVVLLKALDQALNDGDPILGVIKGSGINQDGKTNGITAPSALSQEKLITGIYRKFNIDPAHITYVEAHGTATRLGDPIEVQAITHAFETFGADRQYCAMGSVKTNIGHGAYAAGIAGLIKVLLCLKYKKYVPSVHYKKANPHIDFAQSPFFVNTEYKDWPVAENQTRLAAVSSFGFSGTNAHVVVAESPLPEKRSGHHVTPRRQDTPVMVPLSAKNEKRLRPAAQALLTFLQSQTGGEPVTGNGAKQAIAFPTLADIAYTLQVGREAMDVRVAFVVRDIVELIAKLEAYIKNRRPLPGCYQGHVQENKVIRELFNDDEDLAETVERWMHKQKTAKILNLWVKGLDLDWSKMYGTARPNRISLPTYPFARERYWVPDVDGPSGPAVEELKQPIDLTQKRQVLAFEAVWQAKALVAPESHAKQTWICFLSEENHQQAFERAIKDCTVSTDIIFIAAGHGYEKQTVRTFRICIDDEATWTQAFNAIHAEHGAIDAIQYLWPLEDPDRIVDLAPLVTLFKTLNETQLAPDRIVLAGAGDRPEVQCHLETWMGFASPTAALLPGASVRVVLQKHTDGIAPRQIEDWAHRLWHESRSATDAPVLYTGANRYVRQVRPIRPAKGLCPFKSRGTYLITDGCSPVGHCFAAHLVETVAAKLVLTGPSDLSKEQQIRIKALEEAGGNVFYLKTDLKQSAQLKKGLDEAQKAMGPICGIIHTAGVATDATVSGNQGWTVAAHLAESAKHLAVLDTLSADHLLDFFCNVSSGFAPTDRWDRCAHRISSQFRSVWASARNESKAQGLRRGHTIAIDWPVSTDDGMLDSSSPEVDAALALFEQMLFEKRVQTVVQVQPDVNRNIGPVVTPADESTSALLTATGSSAAPQPTGVEVNLADYISRDLRDRVHKLLKIDPDQLDMNANMATFGFNSINLTTFARQLSDQYGIEITPTVLFGYTTLTRLTEFLLGVHAETMHQYYVGNANSVVPTDEIMPSCQAPVEQKPVARAESDQSVTPLGRPRMAAEPIAIIGMSGKFPKAENPEIFWENLMSGRDCISEVPKDRWDWREYDDDPEIKENETHAKWGGFIDGIGDFDPHFFGITTREAELMDPQQRFLMTYAYLAIEDAGYSPKGLSGSSTGIFVGTQNSGYTGLLEKTGLGVEAHTATGMVSSIGPNRMSYFLDLHGPSEPIETACASSLVAIRRGMMAIESGSCDMAIVGGINTVVTPLGHIAFSKAGMLSADGRCKPFASNADGFVRSEGVGMLVLKKLSRAEADRDHIYGLIRSCTVNHGGRANSLTAPNPLAQTELIASAYRQADIDPRTVTYIEAHGTGTALGDSIEVDALKNAFEVLYRETEASTAIVRDGFGSGAHCGLGSVKSNIGHTELASGMAAVIKVLLQLKHKTLAKSLYCEELNPYIQLDDSPFYVVQSTQAWKRLTDRLGRPLPRRAGVSAFGLGGVNTHMVIEEYRAAQTNIALSTPSPQLVAFSAANPAGLIRVVKRMLAFVQDRTDLVLADLAYTLQVGRDHMASRLALVVNNRTELITGLQRFLNPMAPPSVQPLYKGNLQVNDREISSLFSGPAGHRLVEGLMAENKLEKLALYWTKGGEIPWKALHPKDRVRRLALPTYPFAKNRYWATDVSLNHFGPIPRLKDNPMAHPTNGPIDIYQISPAITGETKTNAMVVNHLFQSWFQ